MGLYAHPMDHWIGVSVTKRITLWAAALYMLRAPVPATHSLEKVVGKLGFCCMARTCCRSIFQDVYREIECVRHHKLKRFPLTTGTFQELMSMLALLPCMTMRLRAPFSPRVFCSDAAPGGHGISYALAPTEQVQDWCRLCDYKGSYTQLSWDGDPDVLPKSGHQLEKVALPLRNFSWKHVGRPGGYRHILLEEAAALR